MCGGLVLCAAQIRLMDLIPSVMSYFSAGSERCGGVLRPKHWQWAGF
jgi:hypothetical protein